MRKKAVKVILSMALSLTVAASFMGSAVQANAQGVAPRAHTHLFFEKDERYYEDANSEYHCIHEDRVRRCHGCSYRELLWHNDRLELHDLRGVAQAPYRWYCVICGYTE